MQSRQCSTQFLKNAANTAVPVNSFDASLRIWLRVQLKRKFEQKSKLGLP